MGAATQQRPSWRRAVRRHRAFGRRGGPLPRRPTDKVNRCDRNKRLTWQRQQEVLDAHRDELAAEIRGAATASAAIDMLDLLPQAATLSSCRGFRGRLRRSLDADRNIIVSKRDLCDWDNPLYKNRSSQEAARRSEERLEASELPVERWVVIDVNDAIAKARLESQAAPG